jgi:hypothetical protein
MPITPQQAAAQLRQIGNPRLLDRAVSNAFRKGGRRIRTDAIRRARGRGILRTLFARKPAGLSKLVTLGRVRRAGGVLQMDLTAKGLAGIQEAGGMIRPHVIKPKLATVLKLKVPTGLGFVTGPVRHPGARHPRIPFVEPALQAGMHGVTEEIRRAVDQEHIEPALRS